VLRTRRLIAVDHLHRGFIDADVAARSQPLIHQVDRQLEALGERDEPSGLSGTG